MEKKKDWKMPKWMEPYRGQFTNTGGNSVEELMNWKGTMASNMVVACLSIAIEAQVGLLMNMYDKGHIS